MNSDDVLGDVTVARSLDDYEAVGALWVCLVKLANRFKGQSELQRMIAMFDNASEGSGQEILSCDQVDDLLNIAPPLETILADPNERLETRDSDRDVQFLRQHRRDCPSAVSQKVVAFLPQRL